MGRTCAPRILAMATLAGTLAGSALAQEGETEGGVVFGRAVGVELALDPEDALFELDDRSRAPGGDSTSAERRRLEFVVELLALLFEGGDRSVEQPGVL